jgi:CRISPR type III-A-associated RAMP protein Csm4
MSSVGLNYSVRFQPVGPWRFGPDSGARDRVDLIYHSDALFSAVCSAMSQLGLQKPWLEATARAEGAPAVRFSSLYPYQGDTLLVIPPRSLWPPPESTKIRYKSARFVPLSVVEALLDDKAIEENKWAVDGESECLIPTDAAGGPFRIALRSSAGVDRMNSATVEPHATACLEFSRNAGLWTIVQFAGEDAAAEWEPHVRSALLLLADSGFGGERSRGWGRSETPEWSPWALPATNSAAESQDRAFWLLSLYTPADNDSVDWNRGSYATLSRSGRIESSAGWGARKAATVMIAEGSVLLASAEPRGGVRDVAPAGFSHPVYRSGFALTVPIPWRAAA